MVEGTGTAGSSYARALRELWARRNLSQNLSVQLNRINKSIHLVKKNVKAYM